MTRSSDTFDPLSDWLAGIKQFLRHATLQQKLMIGGFVVFALIIGLGVIIDQQLRTTASQAEEVATVTSSTNQLPPPQDAINPPLGSGSEEYVPGELVVQFSPEIEMAADGQLSLSGLASSGLAAETQAALSAFGVEKVEPAIPLADRAAFTGTSIQATEPAPGSTEQKILSTYLIRFDNQHSVQEVQNALSNTPEIVVAEPNYLYTIDTVPNDPFYRDQDPPSDLRSTDAIGWDPPYDYLWGLKAMDLESAWAVTRGSRDVTVAVIDTGVDYTNPELGGCTLEEINDDSADTCPLFQTVMMLHGEPHDPLDQFGHGTHVAGTIAGLTNNGIGVAGIADGVRIMATRSLRENNVTMIDTINAIYATTKQGASIINMSWHGGVSYALQDALDFAAEEDVLLIASAGNDSTNRAHIQRYPASHPRVISVGALDSSLHRASFSDYGKVDLVGPGQNILSLQHLTAEEGEGIIDPIDSLQGTSETRSHYAWKSGTSMAAPHIAGLAALVRSHRPELSAVEVRSLLENNTIDLGNQGYDSIFGFGMPTAKDLLDKSVPAVAQISEPRRLEGPEYRILETLELRGFAYGDAFESYTIEIATETPTGQTVWTTDGVTIPNNGLSPITDDRDAILGTIPVSTLNALKTSESSPQIRLRVTTTDGTIIEDFLSAEHNMACQFDSRFVETVGDSPIESITAYGRFWNYTVGPTIEPWPNNNTLLSDVPRYANGPCAYADDRYTCRFDSRSQYAVGEAADQVEVITAYGRIWEYGPDDWADQSGGSPQQGTLLSETEYYQEVCATMDTCRFDAHTIYESPFDPGQVTELIVANGSLWEYDIQPDLSRRFVEEQPLSEIDRYQNGVNGPCDFAPDGQPCQIDSFVVTDLFGDFIESITAYGRFWNYVIQEDGTREPFSASAPPKIQSVFRYAQGPCTSLPMEVAPSVTVIPTKPPLQSPPQLPPATFRPTAALPPPVIIE